MSQSPAPKLQGNEETWFLYIVECRDGSLYTGITNDLDRRLSQHNDGTGARYTRSRRPVRAGPSQPPPTPARVGPAVLLPMWKEAITSSM